MPRVELSLSVALSAAILLLLCCVVLAVLYYRTTTPPVQRTRRIILGLLRGSALFLTALLLLEPLIRIVRTSTLPPSLAVLIDNSASMTLGDRAKMVLGELKSLEGRRLPEGGAITYYLFGPRLSEPTSRPPDSLAFDDEATDLSAALSALGREAKERNIRAALVLSDGSVTMGESPVYEAGKIGIPLFPVVIGDSIHPPDLSVVKVLYNKRVYENLPTPVDVTVRSSGFRGETVRVSLSRDGEILGQTTIRLDAGMRDYDVRLTYVPQREGDHRLSVNVSELQGEETRENNRYDFFVRVLKGRLRVLLVAGSPSADLSAVKSVLRSDPAFLVSSRTQRNNGGFYEGPLSRSAVDSADCIVIIGFPGPYSSRADLEPVLSGIRSGTPALFIASPALASQPFRDLAPLLGVSVQSVSTSEELVFFKPLGEAASSPLISPNEMGSGLWERLPPVYRTASRMSALPGAVVLAVPTMQGVDLSSPLLVTNSRSPVRTASVFAYGLWRWNLMGSGNPDTREHLRFFLSAAVRWLTTEDRDRGLAVRTTREFYPQGQPVGFAAEAYGPTGDPIDNGSITVSVAAGDGTVDASLQPVGNGRYEGLLHGLAPGEYRFRALGMAGGDTIGASGGRFSVGAMNLEFRETRADIQLLRRLAGTTGGELYLPGAAGSLSDDLSRLTDFRSATIEQSEGIELWHWPYTLGMILLLFAAEWLLRKQSGMP